MEIVSIPLWFDSYYYDYHISVQGEFSLNSTMVRFILNQKRL